MHNRCKATRQALERFNLLLASSLGLPVVSEGEKTPKQGSALDRDSKEDLCCQRSLRKALLSPSLAEYQRLRCRVAFHALRFRQEVQELGDRIVQRLQSSGRPFLAFHTGLEKDALAYHGCAERYQDVHTELIQYRRSWMIKHGIVQGELSADSEVQRLNGLCPLMPEEVGILLRAMGYPSDTVIYIAGGEIFGGQRTLIPLGAMFQNLVDRTSLCTVKELTMMYGPEDHLLSPASSPPPLDSEKIRLAAWKNAGPRPRPLPPPAGRPKYPYSVEGWWGWVSETDKEPKSTILELRMQAHKLLWEALDYIVSVEADAFFPGFDRDGNGRPNFASLVMGHRVYESASVKTYRPDRKVIVDILEGIHDHIYKPNHTWLASVREHLNKTIQEEGLIDLSLKTKPLSFLSHPLPECSCRTHKVSEGALHHKGFVKDPQSGIVYGGEEDCPGWMDSGIVVPSDKDGDEEEDPDGVERIPGQFFQEMSSETDIEETRSKADDVQSTEQEEELEGLMNLLRCCWHIEVFDNSPRIFEAMKMEKILSGNGRLQGELANLKV
eukprot:Gb_02584 [translate_table: standard]